MVILALQRWRQANQEAEDILNYTESRVHPEIWGPVLKPKINKTEKAKARTTVIQLYHSQVSTQRTLRPQTQTQLNSHVYQSVTIGKIENQPRQPSLDDGYRHKEIFRVTKKDEITPFTGKWMQMVLTMLSEIS